MSVRDRVLLVGGVVLVLLLAAGVLWWRSQPSSDLERAVALAPDGAQRLTWTDWADVRRELDADLSASSDTDRLGAFLAEAYDADLSPMSALLESAEAMHREYGFSPATLEWELLSQGDDGAAVLMRLPDDTDFDRLGDRLEDLGYQRPDSDTGVWRGGVDLLPTIGTLTPELQHLALDEEQDLVVGSDTAAFAETAMASVTGEAESVSGLDDVVAKSGPALAAAVYSGEVACSSLAMGSADPSDQDQARELVARAGEVNPVTGFSMAALPGGDVRVAMSFESEEQARTNADTRVALASGPAPGQGGDFADRFRLGRVAAEGSVVTMELDPVEGSYVLSDLSSGPVLFATC